MRKVYEGISTIISNRNETCRGLTKAVLLSTLEFKVACEVSAL
jgi:hypothetical protein